MFGYIRWRFAWWYWELFDRSVTLGDPSLGKTREERNINLDILHKRHAAREPKREDFQ